ncbi:MAG: dihydropteroate synthase [Spirochaetales bacterium]|nr:dihydropteroate synthase [Spirochaetales bacterium]
MEKENINVRFHHLGIGDDYPVRIMGVINLSEESFYKGSFVPVAEIVLKAKAMIAHGASILDIGGRSTAPHARPVTVSEEKNRIRAALDALLGSYDCDAVYMSIDTQYREVAEAAFDIMRSHGKEDFFILNDVSGLKTDRDLADWIGDVDKPVILMATHNKPGDSLGIEETIRDLAESLELLESRGVDTSRKAIVDPAIGRWVPEKGPDYDLELCARLEAFRVLKRPVLAGISRKSFIGAVLEKKDPALRLQGTLAATAVAVYNGAHIIRTHDVTDETLDTVELAAALRKKRTGRKGP